MIPPEVSVMAVEGLARFRARNFGIVVIITPGLTGVADDLVPGVRGTKNPGRVRMIDR